MVIHVFIGVAGPKDGIVDAMMDVNYKVRYRIIHSSMIDMRLCTGN